MKTRLLLTLVILSLLISFSFGQGVHSHRQRNTDPRHSVFGPPCAPEWEFQLSSLEDDGEPVSSFNFYRKDHRNKTLFLKLMDNGLNNRSEFRVRQLSGGALLFPYKNDDRFQIDVGGTYDVLKDTSLTNKILFSRVTFRPKRYLWFRLGYESFNGFIPGYPAPFQEYNMSSGYFVGKLAFRGLSFSGLIGNAKNDDVTNTRYGFGTTVNGPLNTFLFGGYIRSSISEENTRTLAFGRWAPFRPDGLPSGFFFWKHKENYDFNLSGILWGKKNLFVRPAALGMTQGIFISSAALRENSDLRRGQLMTITDDYRNADISLFYVYLNKGIEVMPGAISHVGFRAVQLFYFISDIKFSPVLGVFYNEETEPAFDPMAHSFYDKTINFWSLQFGVTLFDRFILNSIYTPDKSEWTMALSFLYR